MNIVPYVSICWSHFVNANGTSTDYDIIQHYDFDFDHGVGMELVKTMKPWTPLITTKNYHHGLGILG